jgi:hypothetical protein
LAACAAPPPAPPPTPTLPAPARADLDPGLGYEAPAAQSAAQILPAELRAGPHHRVEDEVRSDGFLRLYEIRSEFGDFSARGDAQLRTRVAEIRALATLRELGAGAELARAPRRSEAGDGAQGELLGLEQRKREVAWRLGVDPYSPNPVLQAQLDDFAQASHAGGFGAERVPFAEARAAGSDEALRDFTPEDLRQLDRLELAVMGIPPELEQRFAAHPFYSPRQQSLLVAQLAALDLVEGRALFLEVAMRADSEADALLHTQTAELLRLYHEQVAPLAAIAPFRDGVLGVTRERRLVAPLAFDHVVWTRWTHAFANSLLRSSLSNGAAVAGREILMAGDFSPRALAKINERGIEVRQGALRPLGAPAQPARAQR